MWPSQHWEQTVHSWRWGYCSYSTYTERVSQLQYLPICLYNQEYGLVKYHFACFKVYIFPVCAFRANDSDRWSCQEFTKTGLFRTETARYTLEYLRNKHSPVNGKRTGMLVIDSCGDKLKTAGIVYNILSGNKNICDQNGDCFDHRSAVALIGDYSSAVSQQVRRQTLYSMFYLANMFFLLESIFGRLNLFPLRWNFFYNTQKWYLFLLVF